MRAHAKDGKVHRVIHRKWWLPLVLAAAVAVALWLWKSIPASAPVGRVLTHVPIIDAGHGGEDGGASSAAGAKESEINLDVSIKTDLLMRFYGIRPVMVRREDISIHDPGADTLREKKRSDLKNRVELVGKHPDAVLISIHQNTFEESKYFGLQAFYNRAHGGKELAEIIQDTTKTLLDTNNTRVASQVRGDVYLMNNVTCPAVLVECGFLTNAAEERLLRDGGYQTKLAAVLLASFLQWETAG